MQWVLFMHFSLAFIQASVMCLLRYFRFFCNPVVSSLHVPASEVPPLGPVQPETGWCHTWCRFHCRAVITFHLVSLCTSKSCKSQQEVPGSEVWFEAHIKPNWQVWLVFFCRLNQESQTWKQSSHCSWTDSLGPSCFWASCCFLEGLEQELPVKLLLSEDRKWTEGNPGSWH